MLFLMFLKIIAVLVGSIIVATLVLINYYLLCVVKTIIFDKKTTMYAIGFHGRKLGLSLTKKGELYETEDEYNQYEQGFNDAGKKDVP